MEKYRKFDDASCGINPFVPLPEQKLSSALVVPILIRMAERLFNYCLCKMILSGFRAGQTKASYHPEHKDFDFIKNEKGELSVVDKITSNDVIICNNVSLIDYLFLEMAYAPLFTAVAVNKQTGKYGFRKLSMLEIPFHAIGIKFPQEVDSSQCFESLLALKNSCYVKRPIVVFPEGTKTNGRGILSFPQDIVQILLNAADQEKLTLHTLRFDYAFIYTSPYNSTDPTGIKTTLKLLVQVQNSMMIQYYFNLEEKLRENIKTEEKYSYIRKTMMPRGKEYQLQLTYHDHQQFLDYWFGTQDKFYVSKDKKQQ
ncbi:UNKNOWN [Stylonychia lemnae]|uniref:Uncharacterized protein n=1 Tax=Stylonychia lemnae TaxID=5949 RepID=A0A078BBA2_STYLE|nr:UNKNOWN [Stylonychia lemnae]|eukprot:CDW91471.1 UNKNOWN [Stylonychia lemnae]